MFLKLGNIVGDSHDMQHRGEIEVLSFDWGASIPRDQADAANGRDGNHYEVGHSEIREFKFDKPSDRSSPVLFLHAVAYSGQEAIPEAVLSVRSTTGQKVDYLKYKFSTVRIASWEPNMKNDSPTGPRLVEEVTLIFKKCEITYQPYGPDGKPAGGPVRTGYDLDYGSPI
jgi:type VI secretion system secreted protein Hcp